MVQLPNLVVMTLHKKHQHLHQHVGFGIKCARDECNREKRKLFFELQTFFLVNPKRQPLHMYRHDFHQIRMVCCKDDLCLLLVIQVMFPKLVFQSPSVEGRDSNLYYEPPSQSFHLLHERHPNQDMNTSSFSKIHQYSSSALDNPGVVLVEHHQALMGAGPYIGIFPYQRLHFRILNNETRIHIIL